VPAPAPSKLTIPKAFRSLFQPKRFKVFYGGRGAGKTESFARVLIYLAARSRIRVLCTREFQNSIADSVFRVLVDAIEQMGYSEYFRVSANSIVSVTGSEFIFRGLRLNIREIKSIKGIDICWVEEAQSASKESWKFLIPSIRETHSEIWVSFNPDDIEDDTYQRFVVTPPPPERALVVKVNWYDNPFFPEVLNNDRLDALRLVEIATDDIARAAARAEYDHVWEGECRSHTEATIFRGKWVSASFVPDKEKWGGPYFGADWGFSVDPTVLIKAWVHDRVLYVEAEAYAVHCDNDKLPALFQRINGSEAHIIRADNARPETISDVKQHGFPRITAVDKWKGSVEDGIAHLRSYDKIVVHPNCPHTQREMRLYSYKTDRNSGDVLADVRDADNHCIDALRYAVDPLIKRRRSSFG
jgi:phage terminase large subunit